MTADFERLTRLLGGADLAWLVQRMRRRLERGQPLEGSLVLTGAQPEQRRAMERLLGRRVAAGHRLSVRLTTLEATLVRARVAANLRAAVEALGGPIDDRASGRDTAERAWAFAVEPLEQVAEVRPVLSAWLDRLVATGALRRLARGDARVARAYAQQAAAVIDALPARGIPLSLLANSVLGDGHALDAGRRTAALVLPAASVLGAIPPDTGAEWRRTVWASVGVLHGELTNPVLTLNLPGDVESATGRALGAWMEVGQPAHLSARQLLRDPPAFDQLHGRRVYVCENPTVVAEAANHLGARCMPLVCTSGYPAAAAVVLLRLLSHAGAVIVYHGDFDWPGVHIANRVIGRFAARPWRLDAASYVTAAADGGPKLRGRPTTASWDLTLSEAMQKYGVKVEEERVLTFLLDDLAFAA
jgi:uncharacterized protein (TIGR02679 family)